MLKIAKWPESFDSGRQNAISRWRSILLEAPECFTFGLQLMTDIVSGASAEAVETFLNQVSIKATKTLI